jgi:hypothetical protein
VGTVALNAASDIIFRNLVPTTIGEVGGIDGITALASDITVETVDGSLTVAAPITAGGESGTVSLSTTTGGDEGSPSLILQDDITSPNLLVLTSDAGIEQQGGAIVAPSLLIQSTGTAALDQPGNDIGTLQASIAGAGSSLSFTDGTGGFAVANLTSQSPVTDPNRPAGIVTDDGPVTLTALGSGTLSVRDPIVSGPLTLSAEAIRFLGDHRLIAPAILRAGSGGVTFGGQLDGPGSLLIESAGDIVFGGDVGTGPATPLGNVVVGRVRPGFDLNNPAIASPQQIAAIAEQVESFGGDVLISGRFEAAGVIIRVDPFDSRIVTLVNPALDVAALFVDARAATLFGSVAGRTGRAAALVAEVPFPLTNPAAEPEDFTINGCAIGEAVNCFDVQLDVETIVRANALEVTDALRIPRPATFEEGRYPRDLFIGPARVVGEMEEIFSHGPNERLW